MKKNISLLMLTVMALFSACNLYEQPEIDNGGAIFKQIEFQIDVPGIETKTRAIGAAEENAIETIDVLAFKIDGTDEIFDYAVTGTKVGDATGANGSKQAFKVTVQIKEYQQRFVVITNAENQVSTLVGNAVAGTTEKDAMLADLKITMTAGSKWNVASTSNYTAFPMWGESGKETISSSTTGLSNSIQMLRMIAKIDVQLDQTDMSVTNVFKLKSVHLYNTNTAGHVVPDSDNITGGIATAPTIPTDDIDHTGPIAYTDFGTPGITDIAMKGAIYLFETEAKSNRLETTTLVIGGVYGANPAPDAPQTYYRVDLTEADGSFIDILRNHKYLVNITKISGKGYDTVDEAFNAKSINIESEIIVRDESAKFIVTDGQYMLSVSENEFQFERIPISTGYTFTVFTDYVTTVSGGTSGWSVEKVVDDATGTRPDWLMLSPDNGAANVESTVTLTVAQNNTNADRSATIWIAAGRLRVTVKVTQMYTIAKRFARSNIVWDAANNKLTFAVTAADNTTIPANSQGVLFLWGSLVAISPAALSGTTTTYTAAHYPAGHIVYSPIVYDWVDIPYISSTDAPFDNNTPTDDDFATYNGGYGWDIDGTGDICRYISSQGWVSGNWRLPTADEYDKLIAEQTSVSNNGGFIKIHVSSSTPATNHYGFYQPLSGRWLGAGATSSSGVTNPTEGAYFSAGGHRTTSIGIAGNVGSDGYYRSGSSNGTIGSYFFGVSKDDAKRYSSLRQTAFPVRCIRVD